MRKRKLLLVQIIHAVDAVLAGQLAYTADGLVGRSAAAGAGGEVHLSFCVLVHQSGWVGWVSWLFGRDCVCVWWYVYEERWMGLEVLEGWEGRVGRKK